MGSSAVSYRRLPVYIVIDCSSSMNGEAIASVDQGFLMLVRQLTNDPHTADIVCLSIMMFNSLPVQLVPLMPIINFGGRRLPLRIGGSSNMGKAFTFLANRIRTEVRTVSAEHKGDWKPLVFLLSDGRPTDDWRACLGDLQERCNLVACGVGSDADMEMLGSLTSNVVAVADWSSENLKKFIKVLVSTMTTASQRSAGASESISFGKIVIG